MSRSRIAIAAIVILLTTTASFAGLSKEMVQWRKGAVQFLMTGDEIRKWDSIKNDDQAKAFIDLFWARRDPTPATPFNEFKATYDARVEWADLHYSFGKTRGSVTDRGKFTVLLGLPTSLTREGPPVGADILKPSSVPVGGSLDEALQATSDSERKIRSETWLYEKRSDTRNRVPDFSPQPTLTLMFVDQMNTGEYKIGRSPDTNVDELARIAVKAYLISPDLTTVPKYATPGAADGSLRSESLIAALDAFKAASAPSPNEVFLSYGNFITANGTSYVPVQLFLPKPGSVTATEQATFFGRVEDASGNVIKTYEVPASVQTSRAALFADRTLELPAGKYIAWLGIAAGGQPLALARSALDVNPLVKDESGISPLLLSDNIYPLPAAVDATAPFSFGGLKVIVKGDRVFTKADEMWLFCEVRNPGVDEAGAPKLQLKVDLEGTAAGKPVRMGLAAQDAGAQPLKGVPGHYAIGRAIPLASFKPGQYTVKVTVTDLVKNTPYDLEESFKVVQ